MNYFKCYINVDGWGVCYSENVCYLWAKDAEEARDIYRKENGYRKNKKGLTIDRINGNGNYEPINCQWVSRSYNCRFTGRSKPITAKVTLTTVQWSKLLDEKDNFIAEMRKKYGLKDTTEYIEEHLLNKKVLIKRQNTIKEQVQQQLLQEELERQTGNKPE